MDAFAYEEAGASGFAQAQTVFVHVAVALGVMQHVCHREINCLSIIL